jgi:hypothetical protein
MSPRSSIPSRIFLASPDVNHRIHRVFAIRLVDWRRLSSSGVGGPLARQRLPITEVAGAGVDPRHDPLAASEVTAW